jgi:hypothetical protein
LLLLGELENAERVSDQERNRDHGEDYRDLHKRRELMQVGHESRARAGIPTYQPRTQNQEADKCAAVFAKPSQVALDEEREPARSPATGSSTDRLATSTNG